MDAQLLEQLAVLYKPGHLLQIVDLLERNGGFCFRGQMALAEMFLEVQEYDDEKLIEEVLGDLENLWQMSWSRQDPIVRGDPTVTGEVGVANTAAIERFLSAFGIWDSSWPGELIDIPTASFNAKTLTEETYHFGSVDSAGYREISCEAVVLNFRECKIFQLIKGKIMMVDYERRGWDISTGKVVIYGMRRHFDPLLSISWS